MQAALHAATATLPHLRKGLTARNAERAVPNLRALMGAAAIALADTRAVLAIDGEGREQVRPGDLLSRLLERADDNKVHIVPRLVSSDPTCPLRSAVLAPLMAQGKRVGTLIAFYRTVGRPSHHELRVVQEAASLVSAEVELSLVTAQEERVAQAELRALRAQISPHFIYNALAAVAGDIHARPEEARDLLIDFAEFTRYLFRDGRSYVTLGEEIDHVERYLRLEQARFRDSLHVTIDVPAADARDGRSRHVGPAPGRERGAPRGRAARRHRARGDHGPHRRGRRRAARSPTTGSGSRATGSTPCWPAPAVASACRTSTRGCALRSASSMRCGSSPTWAGGRPRS